MSNALHSAQTTADGVHIPVRWEHADTTARDAASYTSADIGGVSRVGGAAPYDFYVLTNDTGPAWVSFGLYAHPDHTGDVTSVGDGAQTIAANAVTNTKAADMAANTVKTNPTGGSADPQDLAVGTNGLLGRLAGVLAALTGTQATTLLDAFTSSLKGLAPASGGGTTNFLRADGTWAAPSASGFTPEVAQSAAESSTTSTTYQNKITLTTAALPSGTYELSWSAEMAHSAGDENDFRVQHGVATLVELIKVRSRPNHPSYGVGPSGEHVTGTISGVQTFTMDYRDNAGSGGTAYIRRALLILRRVS